MRQHAPDWGAVEPALQAALPADYQNLVEA